MVRRTVFVGIAAAALAALAAVSYAGTYFNLPPLPPPQAYGNLLINRTSMRHNMLPVAFSHWSHRAKYTCRVCHIELGFNMQLNTTEITEERNRNGEYCGACHDGKLSFGHTEKRQCRWCHNGNRYVNMARYREFADLLPKAPFGNGIDWVAAVQEGKIKPARTLFPGSYKAMHYDKKLLLQAEWAMIPPAFFPHQAHNQWLDCADCHPGLFNIKKKTTKHFSMDANLNGRFCGLCHLRVAFPLDDCARCHPKMH